MKQQLKILMNQQGSEGSNNGGGKNAQSQNATSTQTQGDSLSVGEMYPQGDEGTQATPPPQGQQTPQTPQGEAGQKSATGYEAPKPGEASGYQEGDKVTPPVDDKKPAQESAKEGEIVFDKTGLSDDAVKLVTDFATANKLTKEATEALAKIAKDQTKAADTIRNEMIEKAKQAQEQQKVDWQKKIREDKVFSENLEANLKRVDTVLERQFPNVKKVLTETKGMVSPEFMKDLLNLHNVLYGSDSSFTPGESTNSTQGNFLEELYPGF